MESNIYILSLNCNVHENASLRTVEEKRVQAYMGLMGCREHQVTFLLNVIYRARAGFTFYYSQNSGFANDWE